MKVIKLEQINVKYEDMLKAAKPRCGRRFNSMEEAARAACEKGYRLIKLRAAVEIYPRKNISGEYLELTTPDSAEKIFIGHRVGLLEPAQEIMIALCTAGDGIADAVHRYGDCGEALMMYYLDMFAVRALSELSAEVRKYAESYILSKGWGVGPSMQPGSVSGWEVCGQRDLYRLGHGEAIGLSLNNASMLVPYISNSALIGMGEHYSSHTVGSMCHECHRYESCLWRKENIASE